MFKILSVREIFSVLFPNFLKSRVEFTSLNCRGIWAGIKINFQIGNLDRVSIKIFRTGRWIGIIAKFSEGRNRAGSEKFSTEGGIGQGEFSSEGE